MKTTRRTFLGEMTMFIAGSAFAAGNGQPLSDNPYETADGLASDSVWVRRIHLDLAGRLPTIEEAQAFVSSKDKNKRQHLVDKLLASESFPDYWSMRFCDILRVKSEFPINLWPNAVYSYHRRIHDFIRTDEPWDHFARALLTATGSDFRDAESNFFRATAQRTPEGFAEAVALTFLGEDWKSLPGISLEDIIPYFDNIRIKHTREWKEEIVTVDGDDRRDEFYRRLTGEWHRQFAAALVQRIDWWLFGKKNPIANHIDSFMRLKFRIKPFIRELTLSKRYARGPLTGGFHYRRLDAEVLDDAICDLTGSKRDYQSIAPEPFTFLPPDRKTVNIEDGSITNAFLLLFGRPSRDSGHLSERRNIISTKQRLFLFNSGKLYQAIGGLAEQQKYNKRKMANVIDDLYWRFYSRQPTNSERDSLLARFQALPKGREKWRFSRDLAWALMNSREFLYQH